MSRYTIALDAMGGDNAPGEIVRGAILAVREMPDVDILLAGKKEEIEPLLADAPKDRFEIIDAREVIGMEEAPMMAVRRKADSSLVRATLAVREGRAGALVSAGSTGAVLACGMTRLGRIKGIERPALGPVLPGVNGPFILVDCGANVDCQPGYLVQFGLMGSVYMKAVLGVKEPRVGLVNIGVEEEKGNKLAKETYQLMQAQTSFNFAGNCEARDVPTGDYDVVVTDGFDGNIIVKYTEGLMKAMMSMLKREMMSSLRTKIGAALAKPAFKAFKKTLDYNEVGGAPMLGVEGAIVKAHGSSGATAICSAIRQARTMLEGDVVEKIREGLKGLSTEEAQ